jgi:RNA recognition motif-containing protein
MASADSESSCILFVGQLPFSCTKEDLFELFSEFGTVKDIRMSKKSIVTKKVVKNLFTGYGQISFFESIYSIVLYIQPINYYRCAHVEYSSEKDAQNALQHLKGKKYRERTLHADTATASKSATKKNRLPTGQPSSTLFVANLPFDFDLEKFDSVFGSLKGFKASRVGNAKRGFAYVEFQSESDAVSALTLFNGASFAGRPMRLDYANSRQTNEFKSHKINEISNPLESTAPN